jgi:large subunit ribosomal protein L21
MYAVIKTGGKQYRVQAGDVLVVEKLDGDVGAVVGFNEVLMVGEGADVTIGAPLVDGAVVTATLIETRKGEKVKIFKKIRRQGYRRTKGHRQEESVLRVTSVNPGEGKEDKWDGAVDLTPLSVLNLRARNLAHAAQAAEAKASAAPAPKAAPVAKKAAAPKAAPAAKAEAAPKAAAAPKAEAAAKPAAAPKKAAAAKDTKADAAPKAAAKPKAKPAK